MNSTHNETNRTSGRKSGRQDTQLQFTSVDALQKEVNRARVKFPRSHTQTVRLPFALMEEVGELAKAMLEGESAARRKSEALQVACVAMRYFEEIDE